MKTLGWIMTLFGIAGAVNNTANASEQSKTSVKAVKIAREQYIKYGFDWYPKMNPKLINALEEMAGRIPYKVMISPHSGALGRKNGSTTSQHHYCGDGDLVNAADIMFLKNGEGLTRQELTQLFKDVKAMNLFSGIGVYPDWQPVSGMHLDIRPNRTAFKPALWGAKKVAGNQKYVDVNNVLV